ncbi:hypothetical protein PQE70_gp108 [Bacillus phage vB_BanS_Nate]|uniref:Uncharacterized protein n=1 Tax=Bacillus phage vB_BanS_Nate TaxID=2894788 RepID=A0AAE8YUV4_9CAUD|nr:hypothetical protein PQE70_gp108 [Bacillus phage vB_BanS_Nate]UGO50961.1 hypothetical protein NATE_108 [Bacillus phage vB_BanS_Nate]
MAKRTRKCQRCKVEDTLMEEMEFEIVGEKRPLRKFYHKACYQEHLKDKQFKAEESEKLDKLVETLKEIYGVSTVPPQAYPFLQKLRNGEPVYGKQELTKRYKEGYDYLLIAETFDYCSATIEYYNGIKGFDGFMSAFRYALSIIIDKIYVVESKVKERERAEIVADRQMKQMQNETYNTNYKRPTATNDITDFLDD